MTTTDLLVIDSKSRSSGSPNSLRFNFSENLTDGTYLLTSFAMTNNLYNVQAGENDRMYVNHSVDGQNVLDLTPGYYTGTNLAVEIKAQLDSISAVIYTVTYDTIIQKYTISASAGTFFFEFGTNTAQSARYLIGFDAADGTTAASQTSDNAIDLRLHDQIAIRILQDNNTHGTLPNGEEFSALIPINASFGAIFHYTHNQNYSQYFKFNASISGIDIELLAGDGDLLPINSAEWCLTMKRVF